MKQFTLKELVKRKLDETYIIIYAIKNEVNIKKAEIIEELGIKKKNYVKSGLSTVYWSSSQYESLAVYDVAFILCNMNARPCECWHLCPIEHDFLIL